MSRHLVKRVIWNGQRLWAVIDTQTDKVVCTHYGAVAAAACCTERNGGSCG